MDQYLDFLRHSASHLLACAVLNLYPEAKPTLGPSIENGFYYDFDFGEKKITEDDLVKIEKEMKRILPNWVTFTHREVSKEEALEMYKDNKYKKELIEEIVSKGEKITIYTCGEFSDLCKGGHIDNPSLELKAFKLLKLAGAYWKGNEKNKMLTRIYGTAFDSQEKMNEYLLILEESKKRDHKKLGKELDLFVFSELVGGGLPLWTPKGTIIREELDKYVWELRSKKGYQKVTIPHITKKDLYEKSGHWAKFSEELFKIQTREKHDFAMKPMNCPHHTQIYSHILRSYKDLPQRYSETTMVYRDEQSGELSGLSRVRSITQDDAHVFCRKSQIKKEFFSIWDIVDTFYKTFGFDLKVRLSFHDPNKFESYIGEAKTWKESEKLLEEIAQERKADYFIGIGEAAMYGPKIDFMTKDSLQREWQVATIQLDMNMPERFNLFCINEKGEEERIVMIHAAIMGSIERFCSVLIEHFAGKFPLWLSPVQVILLPISEKHTKYCEEILFILQQKNIRAEVDFSSETLGNKIRKAQNLKIPFMIITGDKEVNTKSINIRTRDNKNYQEENIDNFTKLLKSKIKNREIHL